MLSKVLLWGTDENTHEIQALMSNSNILKVLICGKHGDDIVPIAVDGDGKIIQSA